MIWPASLTFPCNTIICWSSTWPNKYEMWCYNFTTWPLAWSSITKFSYYELSRKAEEFPFKLNFVKGYRFAAKLRLPNFWPQSSSVDSLTQLQCKLASSIKVICDGYDALWLWIPVCCNKPLRFHGFYRIFHGKMPFNRVFPDRRVP